MNKKIKVLTLIFIIMMSIYVLFNRSFITIERINRNFFHKQVKDHYLDDPSSLYLNECGIKEHNPYPLKKTTDFSSHISTTCESMTQTPLLINLKEFVKSTKFMHSFLKYY